MQNYLLVAVGAAFGGVMRYWVSGLVYNALPLGFPSGTLAVNVLGSFILGFLIFYFDTQQLISQQLKIMLTIGFCGGFTTFSTFSFETMNLLSDSEYLFAFLNISLNVILTIGVVMLSYYLARVLSGG